MNKYSQVQTLILENIQYKHIQDILISVEFSLPKLSTLIVHILDEISFPDSIYDDIYSISTLNYCKLTFKSKYNFGSLYISVEQHLSSIKSFILNTSIRLNDLDLLLFYLLNLHYLSIDYLNGSSLQQTTKSNPIQLISLIKLNLTVRFIKFDQFKQLIIDYFPSIEILYLSSNSDRTYLNAQRWEQLITNHMKSLKRFDLQFIGFQRTIDYINNHHMIERFLSKFSIERQYFFNNQYEQDGYFHQDFFYSTNPYTYK